MRSQQLCFWMDPEAIVLLSLTRLSGPGDTLLTFTRHTHTHTHIPFLSPVSFSLSFPLLPSKSLTHSLFLSLHPSPWHDVRGQTCADMRVQVWDRFCVCVNEWPFKAIKLRLVRPESLITQQASPPTRNGNWYGDGEGWGRGGNNRRINTG